MSSTNPGTNNVRRRVLVTGFAVVATLALTLGVIGGLHPEWLNGSKADSSNAPQLNTASDATPSPDNHKAVGDILSGLKAPAVSFPATTDSTSPASTVSTTTTKAAPASPAYNGLSNSSVVPGYVQDAVNQVMQTGIVSEMQASICSPLTGDDLKEALEGEGCTIINLAAGTTYIMPDESVITSRKIVIGNPLYLPLLDASGCKRLFRVAAGGFLELRFVMTYRGGGEVLANPLDLGIDEVGATKEYPVLRGGSVHVMTGASAVLFGCIFTDKPNWTPPIFLAPDLSSLQMAVTIQGGQIYVNGGSVVMTACHCWALAPGVVLRELYVQGADVLVRAGTLIMTGCTFTRTTLFINVIGVGAIIAQYAGVIVASGCTFTLNLANLNVEGAGILLFQGGGVGIYNGCTWGANLANLDFFGAGIMLFQGGGVLVLNGVAMEAMVANAIACGTGVMITQGGGSLTMNGITQSASFGNFFFAGAGIFNFLGGGETTITGYSSSRNMGTGGVYGVGGLNFIGTGVVVQVGTADVLNAGVASVAVVGLYNFLGVGYLVRVGHIQAINVGALWIFCLGLDTFVGVGGITLVGPSTGGVTLNLGPTAIANPSTLNNYYINGVASARRELAASASPLDPELENEFMDLFMSSDMHEMAKEISQGVTIGKGYLEEAKSITDANVPLGSVFIKNAESCLVDGDSSLVSGPGAAACKSGLVESDAVKALPHWQQTAVELFDAANNTIRPFTLSVVTATLQLGSSNAAGTGLSLDQIETAVKKAYPQDCARLAVSSTKNTQGAVNDELDSQVEEAVTIANAVISEKYLVSYMADSADCAAGITKAIAASDFAQGIESDLVADASDLVGVTVKADGVQSIPSIQTFLDYVGANDLDVASAVGPAPSVYLAGESSANPTMKVGDTLKVALKNFQLFDVNVDLTSSCDSKDAGTFLFKAPKHYFDGGDHSIVINAKVPNVKAGNYAVRATPLGTSSVSWCSNSFTVTK